MVIKIMPIRLLSSFQERLDAEICCLGNWLGEGLTSLP